jgi:DNA-binding MarR family transcriptional regulator
MHIDQMIQTPTTGLGELLRHLLDLLDRGSQDAYQNAGLSFRPRYTPIMRTLDGDAVSVSTLCEQLNITQGAVSQTVKLMETDGLIVRQPTKDNRSRAITLTPKGALLRTKLVREWDLRLTAISELEVEIDAPLRATLKASVEALEREGFADRLSRNARETTND